MSTSKEVVEEKIPWHFLIPFMVVLGFFLAVINPLNAAVMGWPIPPLYYYSSLGLAVICYSGLTVLPFMVFHIANALGRLNFFKKRINLMTMTWLYATTLYLTYYLGRPAAYTTCFNFAIFMANRIFVPEMTYDLVPWFMAPPTNVAKQIIFGGVPVPWADLMPMIIFWWIFGSIQGILMLSVVTLFRKGWIEIERVPFPHALAAYELLVRVIPEKRVKFTWPFTVGLILGILVYAPTLLTALFQWFPDIYAWKAHTCGYGSYVVQTGDPIAALVGFTKIGREPLGVVIAYFAPLSVLFNIWFWWLTLILIGTQVLYYLGYYTALPGTPGCGRANCGSISLFYGDPMKWNVIVIGGMWGLAVFLLVTGRNYIRDTFRAAFGRMDPTARAEFEKNEPLSYRSIYILLAGSFIVATIIYMICGISLASALLISITAIIGWLAFMRLIGLAGVYLRGSYKGPVLHRLLLWPKTPEVPTRDFVLSAYFSNLSIECPDSPSYFGGSFVTAFHAFKVASLTNVSSRSVFKVLVASIIVYPLVTTVATLWLGYTRGFVNVPGAGFTCGDGLLGWSLWRGNAWENCPGTEPWIPHFTFGFIIVGLLSILHAKYIWFPFEPVGFLVGLGMGIFSGFWSYALIAWIVKMLTLKIGGSRAYEEYGVPIATGYIAGYTLILIPGAILGRIRFFIPF